MKFKYIGVQPIKDLDLCLAGIFKADVPILPNTVFEIPDEQKELIQRIKVNGVYEPYFEVKKTPKTKKNKQIKEDKED